MNSVCAGCSSTENVDVSEVPSDTGMMGVLYCLRALPCGL